MGRVEVRVLDVRTGKEVRRSTLTGSNPCKAATTLKAGSSTAGFISSVEPSSMSAFFASVK